MAVANSPLPMYPGGSGAQADFAQTLREHGLAELAREKTVTLQINVGKFCNQACNHCHVEAGPRRTEIMPERVARRVMGLLAESPDVKTVDITGGAPELNANFRWLVRESRRLQRHVIDRCNLTVLLEEGQEGLGEFLAGEGVEMVASLPCYTSENVEKQRGKGVFEKSIEALLHLNAIGYGMPGSNLRMNLVYNPVGASLPPPEEKLEADYRKELRENYGIEFHRLYTITNMPIHRFADYLQKSGKYETYMKLLVQNFNAHTVSNVMCRTLVSVGWDGQLYDCDFNQMLEISMGNGNGRARTIWDVEDFRAPTGQRIATGSHCFGCTAGAGSSCGGTIG